MKSDFVSSNQSNTCRAFTPSISLTLQEEYTTFLSDKDLAMDSMDYLDQMTDNSPSNNKAKSKPKIHKSPKGKYIGSNIVLYSCRSDNSTKDLADYFIK